MLLPQSTVNKVPLSALIFHSGYCFNSRLNDEDEALVILVLALPAPFYYLFIFNFFCSFAWHFKFWSHFNGGHIDRFFMETLPNDFKIYLMGGDMLFKN